MISKSLIRTILPLIIILALLSFSIPVFTLSPLDFYRKELQELLINSNTATQYDSKIITDITADISVVASATPPESARLHAYVASTYHDILLSGAGENQAIAGAYYITKTCLPELSEELNEMYTKKFGSLEELSFTSKQIAELYKFRTQFDSLANETEYNIPEGEGKWYETTSTPPLSPQAGSWERWLIPSEVDFETRTPHLPGSPEYDEQVRGVFEVQQNLTEFQIGRALYWGGYTDQGVYPADLWLDIMYDHLPISLTQLEVARYQKILTQSVADSFMEAWKSKYTHWTERPDMAIEGFETVFDNPNFPSYVSGHATTSQTAADILSHLIPEHKEEFQRLSKEAADSRLWAGVHFDMDNKDGAILGNKVAEYIIENQLQD